MFLFLSFKFEFGICTQVFMDFKDSKWEVKMLKQEIRLHCQDFLQEKLSIF